jgi:tetratricopeptide (TPR) repeat protein
MFCRSCWANLPDGTERCPKCQGDPRVPATPPPASTAPTGGAPSARPAAAAPGAARVPSPARASARRPGFNLAYLNAAIAGALVLFVAGPPAARWWQAQRAANRTDGGAARLALTPAAAPEPSVPRVVEPVAAPRGDDPEAQAAREAFALYQRGQVAAACERYRDLAARSRRDDVRRSLGGCYARLGRDAYQADRFAEAVERYRQAVDAAPERDHWAGLALAHARAGEPARGQSVVEQALRAFPDDPELLYLLADLQERQGRSREAVETLKGLLARESGHARGRTLLTRLEREQGFESGYWSQESPHFLVRYEGGGGIDVGRSVVDILERAYESLGRDLGMYPKERVQVGIYVTKTFAEIGGIPPEFAEHVLGFYDYQKLRLRLSASQAGSIGLERLTRHEYAHVLIHQSTKGRAPRWLHEGLAQVVEPRSAPRFVETEVSLDRRHYTLDGLERLFRSNAVGAAYQLSHVICEYLVDRGGMSGMRAFLERLGQGETVPQALKEGAGVGVEDLDARLLAAGGRS